MPSDSKDDIQSWCVKPKMEPKSSTNTTFYANLSRINLHSLAHCLGINNPQSIGRDALILRVVSAHRVQQLYEGREPCLTRNSKVYTCEKPWQAAIQLRSLGVTDETIIILLKNGIRLLDQLKGLTFKVFVDSGIHPSQAEIIVTNFCGNKELNNFPPEEMETGVHYPNMATMIAARFRCQHRTWPYDNIPFLTFLETFEYDLQLADPTGAEWVDFFRGTLIGRSRCIAEKAIMKNPRISYEELKEIVKSGQTTDAEITNAFKILQSKYDLQSDINLHIEQVKTSVKFIYPDCPDEALIVILLLTLPTKLSLKVRKDMNINELPLVEKRLISEAKLLQPKPKAPQNIAKNAKKKQAKAKNKASCRRCGKDGHTSKKCPSKAKWKNKQMNNMNNVNNINTKPQVIKLEN